MPGWKKTVLAISLLAGVAGLGVQYSKSNMVKKSFSPTQVAAKPIRQSSGADVAPAGSSGFVGSPSATPTQDPNATSATTSATPESEDVSLSDNLTPTMTRLGFSVFIGVVVGFLFRTFLRVAAGLTALIVAAALALSYFHVINVDMTSVKGEAASASAWLTDQAYRLKTMVFSVLPSSTAAGLGFLLGFKRR